MTTPQPQPETLPKTVGALKKEGRRLLDEGRAHEAEPYFLQILITEPNNVFALAGLGECWLSKGAPLKAEEYFQKTLDLARQPRAKAAALNNLGRCSLCMDQFAKAANRFRSALGYDSESVKQLAAYSNLGYALLHLKQFELAEEALRKCLAMPKGLPFRIGVLSNLGAALLEQGKYEEAEKRLWESVCEAPTLAEAGRSYYHIARLCEKTDQHEDALAWVSLAIRGAIENGDDREEWEAQNLRRELCGLKPRPFRPKYPIASDGEREITFQPY